MTIQHFAHIYHGGNRFKALNELGLTDKEVWHRINNPEKYRVISEGRNLYLVEISHKVEW